MMLFHTEKYKYFSLLNYFKKLFLEMFKLLSVIDTGENAGLILKMSSKKFLSGISLLAGADHLKI